MSLLRRNRNRLNVDLLHDPIDSSLRLFALPLTFSFLVQFLYSLIDRFYVSRLGVDAIAAIGSIDQVAFLVFTLGSGFGVGAGILVARRIGEGNKADAGRLATQAVTGMIVIGSVVTGTLYATMSGIPSALGLSPTVSEHAMAYMGTLFLGLVGNFLNFQIFSIVRSTGNTVFPMAVLLGTTVINAVIAPLLIFGLGPFPEMGMAGAGLATATAQTAGACISLWVLISGKLGLVVNLFNVRLDFGIMRRIAKQGFPAALQMMSVSLNRVGIFAIAGAFGTEVLAGYTLGLYADMIVFMFVFSIGMSVEVATGQNLGAGKTHRIKAYHRSAVWQLSVLMLVLGVAAYTLAPAFVGIFTSDPTTIYEATHYLHFSVFGYVFFALGFVSIRVISGAGAAFLSMAITSGTILGIQLPLSWALAHYFEMGQTGIWVAIVSGYATFALISYAYYRRGSWRKIRV